MAITIIKSIAWALALVFITWHNYEEIKFIQSEEDEGTESD